MSSDFIPNSFQTPNAYVDRFMAFLTEAELRVLIYTVRRIFGFQKRQDRISLTQYTQGLSTSDGRRLDYGCGLTSREVVAKTIKSLIELGLIIKVSENDPHKNEGAEYALQLDSNLVNNEMLQARKEARKVRNRKQMETARSVLLTTVSETDRTWSTTLTAPGQSHSPRLVSQTDSQNTVLNPVLKPEEKKTVDDLPARWFRQAVELVRQECPRPAFESWVAPARLAAFQEDLGRFEIELPNEYNRQWVESRLSSAFAKHLTGIAGRQVEVSFTVPQEDPA